jgi:chromate reductase, NAD(P)H dehydrogenase (quinone)
MGMIGTARAQYHLRQCFVFLGCFALNQPEVMVPFAHEKIDKNGRLTDQKTRELIRQLLEGLVTWTSRLSP